TRFAKPRPSAVLGAVLRAILLLEPSQQEGERITLETLLAFRRAEVVAAALVEDRSEDVVGGDGLSADRVFFHPASPVFPSKSRARSRGRPGTLIAPCGLGTKRRPRALGVPQTRKERPHVDATRDGGCVHRSGPSPSRRRPRSCRRAPDPLRGRLL